MCYRASKVVIWLKVCIVPVPVTTSQIPPATIAIAYSAFPTRNVAVILQEIVIVEVMYWSCKVVSWLKVAVVPVPAVVAEVAPATVEMTYSTFPSMNVTSMVKCSAEMMIGYYRTMYVVTEMSNLVMSVMITEVTSQLWTTTMIHI